ncbi:hypothetical protein Cabther_A0014 [Chloracidobacterium thermophilum B]|uniref:Uncharacterized protein n=1 Tax=Chloracidobacterium thermophilum (strain B) TaxID=981222 RepID=G2LDW3_CHLTF|nr:hypothetical protein Cabther_A0014 [Chloracidobacterium thermophilum B]
MRGRVNKQQALHRASDIRTRCFMVESFLLMWW